MYHGIRKTATLILYILGVWLGIQYFLPLFLPFLLGSALALAAEPMVNFLSRRLHFPRSVSAGIGVTGAFCFLVLALIFVLALLLRELGVLARQLPDLEEAVTGGLSDLSVWVLSLIDRLPLGFRDVLSKSAAQFFSDSSLLLDQAFSYSLNLASGILIQVPDWALVLGTAVISSYMISAKLPSIRKWILIRFPKERLEKFLNTLRRLKTALWGWLRAQFKLMGITWLILTAGFILLRVPYAPLWAALTALVDALPVLGTGAVLLPWALVDFLQHNTAQAIGIISTYGVVSLTRSILEPKLVGKQLGLDPLATLAALFVGYRLWGLGGMIAAPVLAVAAVQLLRTPKPQE